MSTIKVNKIEKRTGSTLTLGGPGTAVTLACGATQTGFGRTGTVNWCSTIYTNSPGTVTGVSGKGYFLNTTSGAITINLPSSPSFGDIISIKDYANTFDSNKVTIGRGGSKINGICDDAILNTESQSVTLIYVDGTKGWQSIQDGTSDVTGQSYIAATGGTITTSGDYKIHTFTSSGTFAVSSAGSASGSNKASYLVVAGGGGARCGGAGGGGFREGKVSGDPFTASPLVAPDGLPLSVQSYPITVGAGGNGFNNPAPPAGAASNGSNSIFSTITSAGGGKAGSGATGGTGGSGGGSTSTTGGAGNTPPVSPPQGQPGGTASSYSSGGGGATTAGGNYPGPHLGGTGATSSITASPLGFSGGGGGASPGGGSVSREPTGSGGAGIAGAQSAPGTQCGVANRGGGGGGVYCGTQGNGGSGMVVIRYKFQN